MNIVIANLILTIMEKYSYLKQEFSEKELELEVKKARTTCVRGHLRECLESLIKRELIEKIHLKKGRCLAFRGAKTRVFYRLVEGDTP